MAKRSKFAKRVIAGMQELADALETKDYSRLTIRTVRLPDDPGKYDAQRVRQTRATLNTSQAVFARLMGVSVVLVQSWEQGMRKPSKLACRLLDEINTNPRYWSDKLRAA